MHNNETFQSLGLINPSGSWESWPFNFRQGGYILLSSAFVCLSLSVLSVFNFA